MGNQRGDPGWTTYFLVDGEGAASKGSAGNRTGAGTAAVDMEITLAAVADGTGEGVELTKIVAARVLEGLLACGVSLSAGMSRSDKPHPVKNDNKNNMALILGRTGFHS